MYKGLIWDTFRGPMHSMKKLHMKIKPTTNPSEFVILSPIFVPQKSFFAPLSPLSCNAAEDLRGGGLRIDNRISDQIRVIYQEIRYLDSQFELSGTNVVPAQR